MQRYRWPGYVIQLLGELQRQQNNAQFCDTLLQTEGISVPTHSCILAALSPYLSEKLSASPSPPLGQKRRLQLQAVKAQTLLKLIGLLYSGELDTKGSVEQDDVLSAAHQFGIADLVEGQKDGVTKEGEPQKTSCRSCRERNESRKMQDAQVQAKMAGRRATDFPVEKRSCVSRATQTVKAGEKTAGISFTPSSQTKLPTREPAPSVAQSLDFSITLQPQNITLDKHFNSTCFPPFPSGQPGDGESTLDRSSDSVTNPTSTTASTDDVMSIPISFNGDSNSPIPQEDSSNQQSPESDRIVTGLEDEKANAKTTDKRENAEQPSLAHRDEIVGEEEGNSTEKKQAHAKVGRKRLEKMKQMMETTQISIKVKLRRRTKGEVWEVVSLQDADDTLSVLTSLKQTDHANGEPSSVQPGPVHKPETLILQPAVTNSPEPPLQASSPSDSQHLCSESLTPNQTDDLESVPLAQPPGPVEESDEQIEKLLEDIMMGLNILPNLERDCKKSHHLQPSHDGAPAICQVPVRETDRVHPAISTAGCVYYQDFRAEIGHSSTDTVLHFMSTSDFSPHCYISSCQSSTISNPHPNTNHLSSINSRWIDCSLPTCCTGVHCCLTAQNQPSCSSLSSVQLDGVLTQQQQQQQQQQQRRRSPQYHSSVTPMGQRDGTSQRVMPLSKSQNCPYPQAPTARSVIPSAFNSSGQKLHYPAFLERSSQGDLSILEFSSLTNGISLPCMNELRLPRCLSPLETFDSAAKHQLIRNNSSNRSDKIQPQSSLYNRPWLTANPGSLQYPLSAITDREDKSTSLPQDSKRQKKHLELNPQNRGTCAESCTVKEGGTTSSGQNASEVKSDHRKRKKRSKFKQSDTESDAAVPKGRKRKHPSHAQEAEGPLLANKDVKVNDGTNSQINLSVCSVSMSSNNVLAKDREIATGSSNIPSKLLEKADEPPAITESQTERAREAEDHKTDQTRIRTRGFLKKTQEMPSSTHQENSSGFKPVVCRVKRVSKGGPLLRRRRGRPRKMNLEESSPTIPKKKSGGVESEQQIDNKLPKEEEEEKGVTTKRTSKKRRRNRSEVEVIPLKKTINVEGTAEAEENDNIDIIPVVRKLRTPKRSRMVTLKEFQKLIERQHSKTRKSKESQDRKTDGTAGEARSEEQACGSRCEETELDAVITQPQSRDGIEESHAILSVTVDENHNRIFNTSTAEDTNSSTSRESSMISDDHHLVFSFDVLEEEVAKLAAESEPPLRNPHEAHKACDAGVDTAQQAAVMRLDRNLNPQAPARTAPPLSDAVGFIERSGCDQEEEDEEEEVEVDVLLYSPDKVPPSRQCENGLDNMHISPEEEEEEDVNEIDVTGDEAE